MASPSTSLATLRPELAGSLEEFSLMLDREGFIGHKVFPVFNSIKKSGTFGRIPIEQLLKNRDTARAPGSGYARGDWTFESQSFACEEHGAEEPIDDQQADLYSDYFEVEQISTAIALGSVLREAEKRIAAAVFDPTTWTGAALTTAVTVEWSTPATATPIDDVEGGVQSAYASSGMWPNAIIMGRKVFRNLRNCAQIVDRIKYAGFTDPRAGTITEQAMAQVFDLRHVIVAGGTKNTANEGQAAALDSVWDDEYVMICRVAETNDIREPCIGRTIHWAQDGSQVDGRVETYRDETVRGDVVRVRHDVDELPLVVECGHLLSNITA